MDSSLWSTFLPLLVALVAAGLAIAWVVRPLYSKQPPVPPPVDDRLTALQARKEAVLAAIRELDFDHRLGKLTEEDFARYDARLRRQAIILMQQIEQIEHIAPAPSAPEASVLPGHDLEAEAQLEAEIARRRGKQTASISAESPL